MENFYDKSLATKMAIIFLAFIVIVVGIISIGIPQYRYAHASPPEKCEIRLKKLHDADKFCNDQNQIKSYAAIDAALQKEAAAKKEADRRAALTPQQRCEEDNKTISDPGGDAMIPICNADGTVTYKDASELEDEMRQDAAEAQPSDCNSNYTPCVPDSAYDLDCADIGYSVRVIGDDVYNLDGDGDGYGCESY